LLTITALCRAADPGSSRRAEQARADADRVAALAELHPDDAAGLALIVACLVSQALDHPIDEVVEPESVGVDHHHRGLLVERLRPALISRSRCRGSATWSSGRRRSRRSRLQSSSVLARR
jgi:hypothetical protein